LDDKVRQLAASLKGINTAEALGAHGPEAQHILRYVGQQELSADIIDLLAESRGYRHVFVGNPDFRDARALVLIRDRENDGHTELLVDSRKVASIVASTSDLPKKCLADLPYLSYMDIGRFNTEKYLYHVQKVTTGSRHSPVFFLKYYVMPIFLGAGAAASSAYGHPEAAFALSAAALLSFACASGWDRFQEIVAYNNFSSSPAHEDRAVGITALLKGLGAK
jgi:hypothetical protein